MGYKKGNYGNILKNFDWRPQEKIDELNRINEERRYREILNSDFITDYDYKKLSDKDKQLFDPNSVVVYFERDRINGHYSVARKRQIDMQNKIEEERKLKSMLSSNYLNDYDYVKLPEEYKVYFPEPTTKWFMSNWNVKEESVIYINQDKYKKEFTPYPIMYRSTKYEYSKESLTDLAYEFSSKFDKEAINYIFKLLSPVINALWTNIIDIPSIYTQLNRLNLGPYITNYLTQEMNKATGMSEQEKFTNILKTEAISLFELVYYNVKFYAKFIGANNPILMETVPGAIAYNPELYRVIKHFNPTF